LAGSIATVNTNVVALWNASGGGWKGACPGLRGAE